MKSAGTVLLIKILPYNLINIQTNQPTTTTRIITLVLLLFNNHNKNRMKGREPKTGSISFSPCLSKYLSLSLTHTHTHTHTHMHTHTHTFTSCLSQSILLLSVCYHSLVDSFDNCVFHSLSLFFMYNSF